MDTQEHKTSWSRMEDFRKSPRYYYGRHVAKTIPKPPQTAAMAFGSAFHVAALEPQLLEEQVAIAPVVNKRTKDGKAEWAAFEKANAEKLIVTAEDMARIDAMVAALHDNPIAADLLAMEGPAEHPIEWTHQPSGLVVRGRIDKLADHGQLIIDLKGVANMRGERCGACSPQSFAKTCVNRGYHRQDATYRMGLRTEGIVARVCMIVVANETPHDVAVYELDDDALNTGAHQVEATLHRIRQCLETGDWRSPYERCAQTLELPPWAHSEDVWDAWATADAQEGRAA